MKRVAAVLAVAGLVAAGCGGNDPAPAERSFEVQTRQGLADDSPYAGVNGQAQPDTRLVMVATVDFLDLYLKDRPDGLARLSDHLEGQPLARLETRA